MSTWIFGRRIQAVKINDDDTLSIPIRDSPTESRAVCTPCIGTVCPVHKIMEKGMGEGGGGGEGVTKLT